ncbi:hypothetical protein B566_EDAN005920 [Ephemera danica]|nr:hypothetical protein B566_EDAN005920 [Ephemera danica]
MLEAEYGVFCYYRDATSEPETMAVEVLDAQWDALIERLQDLQQSVSNIKSKFGCSPKLNDVTILVDPMQPPYAVLALLLMMSEHLAVSIASHTHSTVSKAPKHFMNILNALPKPTAPSCNVYVIWKAVGSDLEIVVSPVSHTKLLGEVTAVRYLSRLLESQNKEFKLLENFSLDFCFKSDHWMDKAYCQAYRGSKNAQGLVQTLETHLRKQPYLLGDTIAAADFCMFSVLTNLQLKLSSSVEKWYNKCKSSKWIAPFTSA